MENAYTMKQDEHYRCTNMEWSPDGNVVATIVAAGFDGAGATTDNGYALWTFQGNTIHIEGKPKFYQFQWRPRPKSLLTDKDRKRVAKDLKKYVQRYQADDKRAAKRQELEMLQDRLREYTEFKRWWDAATREWYWGPDARADRQELYQDDLSDASDIEPVVDELEVVVSETVQVVSAFNED